MKNVDVNDLIGLMFLPMTDDKVVDALDALGIEQPALDEEYMINKEVVANDFDDAEIDFVFTDMQEEPCLTQIDFYEEGSVPFPFGIKKSDNFKAVCEKIGRNPDFCSKRIKFRKQWVFPFKSKEIVYVISFSKDFGKINNVVVSEFDRESVAQSESIFPCSELEATN